MSTVERYSSWNIDELIVLDISKGEDFHDLRRDDIQQNYFGQTIYDVLKEISSVCFMPLTFGGRIQNLKHIEQRLNAGADKVTINTIAFKDKNFVHEAVKTFGSQCIVASIDVKQNKKNWQVFINGGQENTCLESLSWAYQLQDMGVGEIILNSIDRDGTGKGFDLNLIEHFRNKLRIPLIICGGAGNEQHFYDAFKKDVDAVCAGNFFHFQELSYPKTKNYLIKKNIPLRKVKLNSKFLSREPKYNLKFNVNKIKERLKNANLIEKKKSSLFIRNNQEIVWCKKCTYPSISAAPMEFDKHGVCTGCQMSMIRKKISLKKWQKKKLILKDIINDHRKKNDSKYDAVIAVSGGKDSYFQVHTLINDFNINPLLVTYDGNNWTDVGWKNLLNMREVFDVDHIIIRPSVKTLKKLNKLAFIIMGDMNWHAHVGIMTVPMMEAFKRSISLVFYGEHGYMDLSGQFAMNDFPEVTYRDRLEHFARGYEWTYFVGLDGLKESDLDVWKYPNDDQILKLDLRGIFLGNYVPWEANRHIDLVRKKYGFKTSKIPFERTYRKMSNLDDMHENGIHDYLKYIKFGYGRATDHTCKDIRAGIMNRLDAIKLVNKYDKVLSSDLQRWLDYVDMDEKDFHNIADTFRDPRVWWVDKNKWKKQLIK